ncbi:MAG TPA: beta-propeller fold lactonase family protein [Terriglobales bacterium]
MPRNKHRHFFTQSKMAGTMVNLVACTLFCALASTAARADGAVYAMTNAFANNQINVYHRAANGNLSLVPIQTVATGGGGSGLQLSAVDSLGSAGSLQLDEGHHLLFAVNTESAAANNGAGVYNTDCQQGTITSFRVASDGTLTFADRVFSGGLFPNSLTVTRLGREHGDDDQDHDRGDRDRDDLLYVLNAGGPEVPICHLTPGTANTPNITGFRVDRAGHMIPLDSTQPIDPGPATGPAGGVSCTAASAAGFSALTGAPAADFQCGLNPPSFPRSAAQVLFSRDGRQLVVTVKGTNAIYVFPVDRNGTVDNPTITQAPGPALPTFFGIAFNRHGDLLVVELFGTATSIPKGAAGAVSTFSVTGDGHLLPISSDVANGATAPAAIVVEPVHGNFAYVSNNLSASISSYTIAFNGSVTLLNAVAATGAGPNDLATAHEAGASFLYVVDAGSGTVGAFQVDVITGALTPVTVGGGLPTFSAQGLAAY